MRPIETLKALLRHGANPTVPRETAVMAHENARELAAAVGPWQIAADYGAPADASLGDIAACFAAEGYRPSVQIAAAEGALEGFRRYLAGDVG